MTEMIKKSEFTKIDVPAFIGALVAVPMLTSLPFLIPLFIAAAFDLHLNGASFVLGFPVVGSFLGLPTYLTFGAYMFARTMRRGRTSAQQLIKAGLLAHVLSTPLAVIGLVVIEPDDALIGGIGFLLLGCIFAPLWSAVFAALYKRMS
jgi:hypothetical protein